MSALKPKNLAIKTLMVNITADESTGVLGALQWLWANVSTPVLRGSVCYKGPCSGLQNDA